MIEKEGKNARLETAYLSKAASMARPRELTSGSFAFSEAEVAEERSIRDQTYEILGELSVKAYVEWFYNHVYLLQSTEDQVPFDKLSEDQIEHQLLPLALPDKVAYNKFLGTCDLLRVTREY